MASKNVGAVPVVKEDGAFIGIITDRDIVTRCNALGKDPNRTKVCECLTANPTRTVPSHSVADATKLMADFGTRRLPVVENDKLVGIISMSDIAKSHAFCPNEKYPNESCILIDMAKELQKSSHLEQGCSGCHI
jgi:predicted transcriptional regulator